MTHLAFCVPVQNEEAVLPKLFAAIDALGRHANDVIKVCLFLNGSSDGSLAVAEAYRNRSAHLVHIADVAVPSGNVGFARHAAMMMGLAATSATNGLLLTTEADSAPRTDWLVSMTTALRKADVVTGRIVRTRKCPSILQDRIEQYYDALFELRRQLDPVPSEANDTHHYAGGANTGFCQRPAGRLAGIQR